MDVNPTALVPEDRRSPYHRERVFYARTLPGLFLMAALDALQPNGRCDTGYQHVVDYIPTKQKIAFLTSSIKYSQFSRLCRSWLYIQHLQANIQKQSLKTFFALIHDLRYIADNGSLEVTVKLEINDGESQGCDQWF
ncbi:hypothetical protein yc1106_04069 [Curvularia clavata]|uniref:Uncharacterized protein n=1 Tax=Curvularia clavata TaxID=95742 RepID=A0A9Q9DS89_CURCL|nr:hypothetical protein yc1106_04069 [Curvularia clavata]